MNRDRDLWLLCALTGLALFPSWAQAQNTFPSSGNVGIGTTNPAAVLEVNGTAQFDNGAISNGTTGFINSSTTVDGTTPFKALNGTNYVQLGQMGSHGYGISNWANSAVLEGTSNLVLDAYSGGIYLQAARSTALSINPNGNVGIGTTSPRSGLEVADVDGYYPSTTTMSLRVGGINAGPNSISLNGVSTTYQILFSSYRDIQADTVGAKIAAINNAVYGSGGSGNYFRVQNTDLAFSTLSTTPASVDATTEKMRLTAAGNLGIGTASPGAKLEVSGNVKLTSGSGASVTYQDGTVQTTAWNGVLGGGDYAESVDVSGDRAQYEPGDVMVIDPSSKGKFMKSTEAYSTAVMGIYSTRPGVVGRRQTTDKSHMKDEVPMAMVGVVPTKVSAESGAIKPGDLLVTSSKPGYAMKGSDHSQMMGAIIGKALEPLDAGTGVIEVAVSIQ